MSLLDDSSMPHTVDLQQVVYAQDDMGGQTLTYTTSEADVPAWVQPVFGMETAEFDQQGFKVTHKVFFNHYPEMSESVSRMVWIDEHHNRHVLKMVAERGACGGLGKLHRVDCEEISNDPDEDS